MNKIISFIFIAGILSACSTATTDRELDNAPINIAMLCLFSCSVEAELEKIDSESGSSAVGKTLDEVSENSGSLSTPEL